MPARALLLGLLLVLGCARRSASKPPDVLLICLDTVRADHLGCYGYERHPTSPHLDRLAGESVVFADASAAACWTKPSVPSFLTGTWPLEHGVYEGSARASERQVTDVLPESALTLAEAFADAGYETAAFVHNAQLRRGSGFEQGFALYEEGNFDAREIRWRAQDWLDERSDGRPFFLYLHFLDAHFPCPVPDEYAQMFAEGADLSPFRGDQWRALREDVNDGRRTLTAPERDSLEALYDGAIRYIDEEVGRFLRALERRGLRQRLVVCVIADHGEEFLEHGRMGHGHGLYENLLRVPWLLSVPGRPPARVEEPVRLIDLFPTLLAAAGIRSTEELAGVDRLSGRHVPTPVFAEHKEPGGYVQSWREGSWKLVRRFVPSSQAPGPNPGFDLPSVGTRREVDVEASSPGKLHATDIAPSSEPASDPIEVKGPVERREPDRLEIAGVAVRVTPATELYGEVPQREGKALGWKDGVAAEGTMVKAIGAFAEGAFAARRLKVYAQSEPLEREIRGPVDAVEGTQERGRLRIGDAWIEWDAATRWSGQPDARAPALPRERIADIVESGAAEAARSGFRVEIRLYDLAADPGELAPVEDPSRAARLGEAMDDFARGLLGRKIWGSGDRAILKPDTIEALRGLGYVR